MTREEFDAANARVDLSVHRWRWMSRGTIGLLWGGFMGTLAGLPSWYFWAFLAASAASHAIWHALGNHIARLQLGIMDRLQADLEEIDRQYRERMPS